MPKFRVTLQTVASWSKTIEANDEEAAIDAAFESVPSEALGNGGSIYENPIELGEWSTANESISITEGPLSDAVQLVED